jgi:hypothetical protein
MLADSPSCSLPVETLTATSQQLAMLTLRFFDRDGHGLPPRPNSSSGILSDEQQRAIWLNTNDAIGSPGARLP